jgi:hypothetical protein
MEQRFRVDLRGVVDLLSVVDLRGVLAEFLALLDRAFAGPRVGQGPSPAAEPPSEEMP